MGINDVLQEREGILRFLVSMGDQAVEAFLSRASCEAALRQVPGAGSLADVYPQYRTMLDRIVLSKVDAGARQPVVVMARDLQQQQAMDRRTLANAGWDRPAGASG